MARRLFFSWNAFLTYRNCPLRYKKIYLTETAPTVAPDFYNLIYGSIMHEAVEKFYKEKLWKSGKECSKLLTDFITKTFENYIRRSPILWNKSGRQKPADLLLEIVSDVPKIIAVIKDEKLLGTEVYSELNLRAQLTDFAIGGRADLLLTRPQGLTLIDGKGSKSKNPEHKEQLLFYALCFYLKNREFPKYCGVWYFRESLVQWLDITIDELKKLRDEVLNAHRSIEQKIFDASKGDKNCFWCEFKNTCLKESDHLQTPFGDIVEAFL